MSGEKMSEITVTNNCYIAIYIYVNTNILKSIICLNLPGLRDFSVLKGPYL